MTAPTLALIALGAAGLSVSLALVAGRWLRGRRRYDEP